MGHLATKTASALVLAAAVLAWGPAAVGQDQDPTTVGEVVITPEQKAAADRYVDSVTVKRRRGQVQGQIARWKKPTCIRAIGGSPGLNTALANQVAAVVRSEKLVAKTAKCTVNTVIVLTNDPDGFAERFAQTRRWRFFGNRKSDIEAFKASSGPVRSSHAFSTGAPDGGLISQEIAGYAGMVVGLSDSKLQLSTQENIDLGLVVVDSRRLKGISPKALAHYIAFVLLADLPPDANSGGQPSILDLFAPGDEARPEGFTVWDRGFLRGLYTMSPDLPFQFQQNQIQGSIERALAEKPEAAPP
jgi:hypothetical protein